MTLTLSTSDLFGTDDAFLMTRAELETRRPNPLHTQDFYELLWVQNGSVRLHFEDTRWDLSEGDLVFIQPDIAHGLQGRGEAAMLVSISIRAGVLRALGSRAQELDGRTFWANGPERRHRDIRQLADLNQAALRLERGPRSKLHLEAFLLPLLIELDEGPVDLSPEAPDWLRDACIAARKPQVFQNGAAGFVTQTGRAHPHVSRTTKRFLGMTPSDFINQIRMDYAARTLVGTQDPLSEIAADCGIPNLSHFHKLFLSAHGETPQRYRRARQRDMVQPR